MKKRLITVGLIITVLLQSAPLVLAHGGSFGGRSSFSSRSSSFSSGSYSSRSYSSPSPTRVSNPVTKGSLSVTPKLLKYSSNKTRKTVIKIVSKPTKVKYINGVKYSSYYGSNIPSWYWMIPLYSHHSHDIYVDDDQLEDVDCRQVQRRYERKRCFMYQVDRLD